MLKFDALIRGRVHYDGPHGQPLRLPPGRCTVEAHMGFVGLTWIQDGTTHQAVLTLEAFEAALETAALLITDSSQLRAVHERAVQNAQA